MLKSQNLKVSQVKEPCIALIQENLIENSVQDCLPYILLTDGPCSTTLAYPKWLYVCLKAIMYIIHNLMLFLLEPSTIFHHGIWPCNSVTMTCDIPLIPKSSPKNRIDWEEQKKEKKNRI